MTYAAPLTPQDASTPPITVPAYGYATSTPHYRTLYLLMAAGFGSLVGTTVLLGYLVYRTWHAFPATASPTAPFSANAVGDQVTSRNLGIILTALASFAITMLLTWIVVAVAERAPTTERFGHTVGWTMCLLGAVLLIVGVTFEAATIDQDAETRYAAQATAMQTWAHERYDLNLDTAQAVGLLTVNPDDGAPVTDAAGNPVARMLTPAGLILVDASTRQELPTTELARQ